jgi:pimeloyl-ACP methyl ester carboxylesterase
MVDSFATVSNRRIGYTDVGAGPTVLLLHGDTLDRRFWSGLIEDLSEDYRVIAPDTRGHGQSPDTRGPFSYEDFADDWRILIDELDLGPVAVVGHSGGADTALLMGLTYPELVRGMVLAGCPYHVSNYHEGSLDRFENADFEEYLAWAGEWAEPAIAAYGDIEEYKRFWSRMFHELFTREPNLTPRELRRITPPALVIHAENEESFDLVHSEELARLLPNAELLISPGATHMTVVSQDAALVHGEIRRFLASLDGEDPA